MNLTAMIAAHRAARALKLPTPRVQWVKTDPDDHRAGWADKDIENTIFLSIDWAQRNGVKQLQGLTYHETRHLWQNAHGYFTELRDRRRAENDANRFVFDQLGILLKLTMWWETEHYD